MGRTGQSGRVDPWAYGRLTGETATVIQQDLLLPCQVPARTRALAEGERRLREAVLYDAVYRMRSGRDVTGEAAAWVARDDTEPFGFQAVCEALGFAPSAVRRALGRPARVPHLHATAVGRRSRLSEEEYHRVARCRRPRAIVSPASAGATGFANRARTLPARPR